MENEKYLYCVIKCAQCPEMYSSEALAMASACHYIGHTFGYVEVWDMVKRERIYYWCY